MFHGLRKEVRPRNHRSSRFPQTGGSNVNVYLDNGATTRLTDSMKRYLTSVLDLWGNPSSLHSMGEEPRQILRNARRSVASFLHAEPNEVFFTPSGSGSNTLAVKGLTSENPSEDPYDIFYSPTAHKSLQDACRSCVHHAPLKVDAVGRIHPEYLEDVLTGCRERKPLVCIEAANSEIGTMNDVAGIGAIVRAHHGTFLVDATGYVPSREVDVRAWRPFVDLLTFSGHKLHALKGIGVLWKREGLVLKPLIYGSQQDGIIAGTENVLGIASLGKAVTDHDYASVSSADRDTVHDYVMANIPDCYLVGPSTSSGDRLPNNLYLCFRGVEGEALMLLLDTYGIQVSTGSACTSGNLTASAALTAIGMKSDDLHSCIRLSFGEKLRDAELSYVCRTLKQCVEALRSLPARESVVRDTPHS